MTDEQIKKIVEESFVTANQIFECPPICLEISGEYGNQIFATLGNFSVILAPPKVGKTTTIAVGVSSLLTGKPKSKFIPSLPYEKRVIAWADTEQGKPECVRTIKSICTQTTGNDTEHPENLVFLSLRKHGKNIRLEAIEYLISHTPNIGFLVIDGVRDLVSSINDEKEATLIADKLLKWSQELNIHIMCVLHENKGDKNARGHLGTELMNKAETVAGLSRGENNGNRTTIVESKHARHKEFESFAFTFDNGNVIQSEIKQAFDSKNPTVEQLTHLELESVVSSCFSNVQYLPYGKFWPEIKKALSQLGIDYGDNKCKLVLTKLQKDRYILYESELKHYSANLPV